MYAWYVGMVYVGKADIYSPEMGKIAVPSDGPKVQNWYVWDTLNANTGNTVNHSKVTIVIT